MKIIVILFLMVYVAPVSVFAQVSTADTAEVDTGTGTLEATDEALDTPVVQKNAIVKIDTSTCQCVPIYDVNKEVEGWGKWFIILLPFYLLALVVLIVAFRLQDFKFTEALSENDPPKKTIKNPEYSAAIIAANSNTPNLSILFPPTIEVSNITPSVFELRETLKAKEAEVSAVEAALVKAKEAVQGLKNKENTAKTDLEKFTKDLAQLEVEAATADEGLKKTKETTPDDTTAIAAAEENVRKAKQAISDLKAAQATLQEAQDAVKANEDKIATLPTQLEKAKAAVEDAQNNVSIAEAAAKANTTYSINSYRASVSRYIAFITSMVIIILVVCMSSFFIYHYMRTGCPADFGALTMLLIALGLGMVPYMTNKISTAAFVNKS